MEAPYQQLQRFPHFNLALLRATGQHARLGPKMDMDAIGIAQKSFEMVTEIVKMMKNEAVLEHNNPSIRMAPSALIMEVTVTRGQNASYGIGLETTANGVYVMAVDPDSSSKLNAYCGMKLIEIGGVNVTGNDKEYCSNIIKQSPTASTVLRVAFDPSGMMTGRWLRLPWFHGAMTKEEASIAMADTDDGQFLVRERADRPGVQALCCTFGGKPTHHEIQLNHDGHLSIKGVAYGLSQTLEGFVGALQQFHRGWPVLLAHHGYQPRRLNRRPRHHAGFLRL